MSKAKHGKDSKGTYYRYMDGKKHYYPTCDMSEFLMKESKSNNANEYYDIYENVRKFMKK